METTTTLTAFLFGAYMAKLSRLQTRLSKIQSRISEIEAVYPTLAKYKAYSQGFGNISTTYQSFGEVGREYQALLRQEEALEDQIADIQDAENSGSSVAVFRGINS